MKRLIMALVLPLLASACYSPNIPNGMQKCGGGNSCAEGYQCAPDGFCYKKGQLPNGGSDGGGGEKDLSVACTQASCKAPTPICDPDSGQCVPCLTDVHCPDGLLCKMKACVPGCSMSHGCGDAGMCDPNGMCKVCKMDADCGMNTPRCDTGSGRCVPCLPMNDNCTNGNFCKQVNGQYTCVMGCKVDLDCKPPAQDGGVPPKMVCCQNSCVDVNSDAANCGVCGKGCNGQTCCTGACTDTTADLANCGGCGVACSGKHASWSCMASSCKIAMCQGAYGDCNVDPTDGCEINTAADANNCLGCGTKCMLANAVAGCANGCFVQSCNMGFGNCDNNAMNGCEANLANNLMHCGICGKVCGAVANGAPTCMAAMCGATCNAGFGNCDGNPANGCESTLASDPANCGMCGNSCPTPANASRTCVANMCGFTCNAGFANCDGMAANGCEVNTTTDPNNCGVCARVCSNANMASRTCGGGLCNGNCAAGFADCNANKQTDGCEINTNTDINNCGMCARVCNPCNNGMCGGVGRTIPNFMGQLGPDYSAAGWSQCVGYLDKINIDDIPNMNWATPCIGNGFNKIRIACGANAVTVRYIDIVRNVFSTGLNAYPEVNLINGSNFALPSNDIYASGNQPNTGTSWWVNGNGCDEASQSITINNGCPWDASNCFGQSLAGDRFLYVYVHN